MPSRTTSTTLILAERGSDWTAWIERFRPAASDVVVVLQEKGETASEFSTRARAKIAELATDGRGPARAVLTGGGRTDRDALAARSMTIRAIAAEMANVGGGELLLDGTGRDRFSMEALASTVRMLVHGTGVDVRHVAPSPKAAA